MNTIKLKPTTLNITLVFILILLVVIAAPLVFIWALNTLFPVLAIPYTVETWLAAFIIPAVFKTKISTNKD